MRGSTAPLTFREINPDSSPELHVTVEDDSLSLHPDTLQPGSAAEPGRVVGAPQYVVDRGGPAPSGLMELPLINDGEEVRFKGPTCSG